MKILVIGATGLLGKPVAKELIKSGFDVTLLMRDISKAQALLPGAKLLPGDVFDKNSLVKAMNGMDAIHCNLSVLQQSKQKDKQPEREGIDNIIAAAKETNIHRISYLSSLVHRHEGVNGFRWWAFQIKEAAVQKIRSSGIPYTIFYPSTFMETYPYQVMKGNKIAMAGKSEASMWFVAAADYAKQVAVSFKLLQNENRDYDIQGPEPYNWDQANKIFIENYTKAKLKVLKAPIGVIKFLGLFSQKLNYGGYICEALNKYPEKFEGELAWKELGKPTTTLAEFARGL